MRCCCRDGLAPGHLWDIPDSVSHIPPSLSMNYLIYNVLLQVILQNTQLVLLQITCKWKDDKNLGGVNRNIGRPVCSITIRSAPYDAVGDHRYHYFGSARYMIVLPGTRSSIRERNVTIPHQRFNILEWHAAANAASHAGISKHRDKLFLPSYKSYHHALRPQLPINTSQTGIGILRLLSVFCASITLRPIRAPQRSC